MSKIMLVEDDNNLREIYEARLIAEGYEIVSAKDGEEALALAVKEKPDLIISDVMMPKISGFDMLDILRTTPETKNTKIIMMTALSQAEDKERADKLGADRYLVKSQVTLEDVAAVAREVLSGEAAPAAQTGSPDPVPAASPDPMPQPVVDESNTTATDNSDSTDTDQQDTPSVTAMPAPVSEPAQPPATDPVTNDDQPDEQQLSESSQDQGKKIEDQINNFVENAKTTEPAEEPKPTPTPVASPPEPETNPDPVEEIAVAEEPQDATTAAADNAAKLADAVNDLLDKPATETGAQPQAIAPEHTPTTTDTTPETPAPNPVANQNSPAASKKVITPINDLNSTGPDLNALLQQEELKNAQANSGPAVDLPQPSAPETEAANINISEDGTINGNAATATAPTEQPAATETPVAEAPESSDPNSPNNIAL